MIHGLAELSTTCGRGENVVRVLAILKGRISPFLFLKEKLFELYGIFTVAFIKYKKYEHVIECENVFFLQEGSSTSSILATAMETLPFTIKQFTVYGAFVT